MLWLDSPANLGHSRMWLALWLCAEIILGRNQAVGYSLHTLHNSLFLWRRAQYV